MVVSLIVALAENHCIGVDNKLPWRQSADLQHFKKITLNKPIIMGRKTYESIGKPLPQRQNIVVTHNREYQALGCELHYSLESAIDAYKAADEIMVIGGGALFIEALPLVDRMYLTWIHSYIDGDTFFPDWDKNQWCEIKREHHTADENNEYDYSFAVLERI